MSPLDIFTQVSFEPVPTAFILVTTAWYLLMVRRLAKGRRWPVARTVSWLIGELMLTVALVSGMAVHDKQFSVHAIQHILLAMAAPIFFALSAPITLTLAAGGDRVRRGVNRILRSTAFRVVSHPVAAWAVYGTGMFVLYFTSLYRSSVENGAAHSGVNLGMLLAGCMFWWPVIGQDPLPFRLGYIPKMGYLIFAMPYYTILGMGLQSQSTPIAPGMSLSDLHNGGGLIWVAGELMGLIGVLIVFAQWLMADERRAKREDQVNDVAAAAQLAHWRATREAAARAVSGS
jgi:putative copper resistance protein D